MSLCLLEEGMAIPSSILPWRSLWTEKPGRLQSGSHKESDTTEWVTLSLVLTTGGCYHLKLAWKKLTLLSVSHTPFLSRFIVFTERPSSYSPITRFRPINSGGKKTLNKQIKNPAVLRSLCLLNLTTNLSLKFLSPYVPILSFFDTLTGLLAHFPSPHFHPRFRALCTLTDRSLTYTSFRTWTHLLPNILPPLCLPGTTHFFLPKNSPLLPFHSAPW